MWGSVTDSYQVIIKSLSSRLMKGVAVLVFIYFIVENILSIMKGFNFAAVTQFYNISDWLLLIQPLKCSWNIWVMHVFVQNRQKISLIIWSCIQCKESEMKSDRLSEDKIYKIGNRWIHKLLCDHCTDIF